MGRGRRRDEWQGRVTLRTISAAFATAIANAHAYANQRKKTMLVCQVTIAGTAPYIGNHYWPEMYRLIEITKNSGMNRARTQANRRKALEEYLSLNGMTLEQFNNLEVKAKRPFFMEGDMIAIPEERMLSFLVATCDTLRSAQRPCQPDQVRSRFECSHFITDKKEPDGIWSRFVTVTAGTGNKLSNQRGLREDPYIEHWTATGTIKFDPDFVKPDVLKNALILGGSNIGIGAARKMGRGRFALVRFDLEGTN